MSTDSAFPAVAPPAADRSARFQPGAIVFGRYRILRKLGQGGMGEVWHVRQTRLDCDRVLKLIDARVAASREARDWFNREARSMARINHPNAVQVHAHDVQDGEAFIEMEYVAGRSLDQVLRVGGSRPMPLDWVEPILDQLGDVLDDAHRRHIVHRDLKPANLMLVDGQPPGRDLKVLDFGIAKLLEPGEGLTAPGQFVGSSGYASPEQRRGEPIDHRSDIYSVGVLLHLLLTGRKPEEDPRGEARPAPPPWPGVDRGPIRPEVRDLVVRCLAEDPNDRPQSAGEISRLWREARREAPAAGRSGTPARRRRRLALGLVTGLAALLLGGVLWWGRRPASRLDAVPAPPLGAEAVLEAILADVRTLDAEQRRRVRYVSLNHRLVAGADAFTLGRERLRLEAALGRFARPGAPAALEPIDRAAGVFRLDLRHLGWDARPYRIAGPDGQPQGPAPITLHDLLLLEYPYGWVDPASPAQRALQAEYLTPAALVRPLPSVRGDWLAEVLARPDLARDLRPDPGSASPRPDGQGPDDTPSLPAALAQGDAAAELGFDSLSSYQRRRGARASHLALDSLARGATIDRRDWDLLFPGIVLRLGLGEPIVPIDGLDPHDLAAASGMAGPALEVNKAVFQPGDPEGLIVWLRNDSDRPLQAECLGLSVAGEVARFAAPGAGARMIAPGLRVRFPEGDGLAYEIREQLGRDRVIAFTADVPFPPGWKLVAPGRGDRFVHLGPVPYAHLARRVIDIETREP